METTEFKIGEKVFSFWHWGRDTAWIVCADPRNSIYYVTDSYPPLVMLDDEINPVSIAEHWLLRADSLFVQALIKSYERIQAGR